MKGSEVGSLSEAKDDLRRRGCIASQNKMLEVTRVMLIKTNRLCLLSGLCPKNDGKTLMVT